MEPAPGVDEEAFAEPDVLTEVRGERREEGDGVVDRAPDEANKALPDLRRFVVARVELPGDPECFLTCLEHHGVRGRTAGDGLAGVERGEKVGERHAPSST
ncbi:hypothetical protein [Georgenia satyanarayanai]|uniref:hypothetical protein n=1 Tax=Georgenia satyanarayanai TaxID=860221 RepID=UPI0027B88C2A|nr:hypothetical protein [Georgenia satyanarayanai]